MKEAIACGWGIERRTGKNVRRRGRCQTVQDEEIGQSGRRNRRSRIWKIRKRPRSTVRQNRTKKIEVEWKQRRKDEKVGRECSRMVLEEMERGGIGGQMIV